MVTAIDVPAATTNEAASDTPKLDNVVAPQKNNGILTLPEQSDSSSDDDDSVEKSTSSTVEEHADKDSNKTSSSSHGATNKNAQESSLTSNKQRRSSIPLTSFDIESTSAPSPTKKRRVHSDRRWDGFVRKGARLKGLLEDAAMHLAASHQYSNVIAADSPDDRGTTGMGQQQSEQVHNHAADIAREKTAECMILQQKLKEAQATAATMTAANASLREAASASNERMERTVQALKIAGTNAANARADADAAEACAASMATQLQALREVVDETKRASQVLYKEHEQVSTGARLLETKLVQKETEFARLQKEQRQWMEERDDYKKRAVNMQATRKSLETEISHLTSELQECKRQAEEYAAMEQARKDRAKMVEQELRQARTMLQEATATAAESESTVTVLNETIASLETENKSLHETMEQLQAKARQEVERLNDSLTKAEKEAQTLRVKASTQEEAIQRAKMDKSASDKQVTKLKTKVASLERRLKDAASYSTLEPQTADESGLPAADTTSSRRTSRGVSFTIPPLTTKGGGKENGRSTTTTSSSTVHPVTPAPKSSKCSICSQPLKGGFVKPCQCGKPSCNLRAHATCITKVNASTSSVSHPGTPAMRPPVILCGTAVSNKN